MKPYAIILAGGSGLRAGSETPKQFLELNGKMMLQYSLEAFKKALPGGGIVLVVAGTQKHLWGPLLDKLPGFGDILLAEAGPERFFSVKNGLEKVPGETLVAIHDAARPLVTVDLIRSAFHLAGLHGCCIPAITPADSIRLLSGNSSRPLPRNSIRMVQTPQVFYSSELKSAYQTHYSEAFTDDASVWESAGHTVFICEGQKHNLKITTPDDFRFAGWLLSGF